MKRIPYALVDVFAPAPGAGNRVAVVLDARGMSPEEMQAVAQSLGAAEAAFLLERTGAALSVRFFAPGGGGVLRARRRGRGPHRGPHRPGAGRDDAPLPPHAHGGAARGARLGGGGAPQGLGPGPRPRFRDLPPYRALREVLGPWAPTSATSTGASPTGWPSPGFGASSCPSSPRGWWTPWSRRWNGSRRFASGWTWPRSTPTPPWARGASTPGTSPPPRHPRGPGHGLRQRRPGGPPRPGRGGAEAGGKGPPHRLPGAPPGQPRGGGGPGGVQPHGRALQRPDRGRSGDRPDGGGLSAGKPMVRLVFVDVDGTLVGREGVPPCVWPEVEALKALGVRFALVTGRPGRGRPSSSPGGSPPRASTCTSRGPWSWPWKRTPTSPPQGPSTWRPCRRKRPGRPSGSPAGSPFPRGLHGGRGLLRGRG